MSLEQEATTFTRSFLVRINGILGKQAFQFYGERLGQWQTERNI